MAFLQQGGSSSSGVLRASEPFPAPSPAMDPVPPPWGFQPLIQGNRGWRRSCHVGWQVLLLFSHIAYRDER
ncbi:hypothetical protein MUK42_31602 [Musa troglodytarum]|uniref:Uncharacterized protein n=1 Tax=Musa troglodytarum TaxID=320322 RepID=A0A9E7FP80_9LILI|nr:hypothetical protein MUK42_31602 [Musa troglodytarum]